MCGTLITFSALGMSTCLPMPFANYNTRAKEVPYKRLTRPSQYSAVHCTWYLAQWCLLKFVGDPNFSLEVTNRSHQKVSMLLLKIVKKLTFLWVILNEDLCNMCYPRCLENKVVVLSKSHELVLLWDLGSISFSQQAVRQDVQAKIGVFHMKAPNRLSF